MRWIQGTGYMGASEQGEEYRVRDTEGKIRERATEGDTWGRNSEGKEAEEGIYWMNS